MNDVYKVKETPYETDESKNFSTVGTFDLYQVHFADKQLRSTEINLYQVYIEGKQLRSAEINLYEVHIEDKQLRSAEINLLKQSECN